MAFSNGSKSTDAPVIKKYTGIATVSVVGFNPTLDELNKIYGKKFTTEPKYVDKDDNGNDRVRLDFYIKTDPDAHKDAEDKPLDLISRVSIYLSNIPNSNKDATKFQIIDVYGRTAWATSEEIEAKAIPQYKNGAANIDPLYRKAYYGEEALIDFLIAYINISSPATFNQDTREWTMKSGEELALCKASLEHIDNYFKGDFSEIKTILEYQPNNKIKVLFGVDTDKMYQKVYSRRFQKTASNDSEAKFKKEIEDAKSRGSLATIDYTFGPLQEYTVAATNFDKPADTVASADVPWS